MKVLALLVIFVLIWRWSSSTPLPCSEGSCESIDQPNAAVEPSDCVTHKPTDVDESVRSKREFELDHITRTLRNAVVAVGKSLHILKDGDLLTSFSPTEADNKPSRVERFRRSTAKPRRHTTRYQNYLRIERSALRPVSKDDFNVSKINTQTDRDSIHNARWSPTSRDRRVFRRQIRMDNTSGSTTEFRRGHDGDNARGIGSFGNDFKSESTDYRTARANGTDGTDGLNSTENQYKTTARVDHVEMEKRQASDRQNVTSQIQNRTVEARNNTFKRQINDQERRSNSIQNQRTGVRITGIDTSKNYTLRRQANYFGFSTKENLNKTENKETDIFKRQTEDIRKNATENTNSSLLQVQHTRLFKRQAPYDQNTTGVENKTTQAHIFKRKINDTVKNTTQTQNNTVANSTQSISNATKDSQNSTSKETKTKNGTTVKRDAEPFDTTIAISEEESKCCDSQTITKRGANDTDDNNDDVERYDLWQEFHSSKRQAPDPRTIIDDSQNTTTEVPNTLILVNIFIPDKSPIEVESTKYPEETTKVLGADHSLMNMDEIDLLDRENQDSDYKYMFKRQDNSEQDLAVEINTDTVQGVFDSDNIMDGTKKNCEEKECCNSQSETGNGNTENTVNPIETKDYFKTSKRQTFDPQQVLSDIQSTSLKLKLPDNIVSVNIFVPQKTHTRKDVNIDLSEDPTEKRYNDVNTYSSEDPPESQYKYYKRHVPRKHIEPNTTTNSDIPTKTTSYVEKMKRNAGNISVTSISNRNYYNSKNITTDQENPNPNERVGRELPTGESQNKTENKNKHHHHHPKRAAWESETVSKDATTNSSAVRKELVTPQGSRAVRTLPLEDVSNSTNRSSNATIARSFRFFRSLDNSTVAKNSSSDSKEAQVQKESNNSTYARRKRHINQESVYVMKIAREVTEAPKNESKTNATATKLPKITSRRRRRDIYKVVSQNDVNTKNDQLHYLAKPIQINLSYPTEKNNTSENAVGANENSIESKQDSSSNEENTLEKHPNILIVNGVGRGEFKSVTMLKKLRNFDGFKDFVDYDNIEQHLKKTKPLICTCATVHTNLINHEHNTTISENLLEVPLEQKDEDKELLCTKRCSDLAKNGLKVKEEVRCMLIIHGREETTHHQALFALFQSRRRIESKAIVCQIFSDDEPSMQFILSWLNVVLLDVTVCLTGLGLVCIYLICFVNWKKQKTRVVYTVATRK